MDRFQLSTVQKDDKFLNALAEAYRLQEAIISATELCIISTSHDGYITSFNKAAETLLGYTADEILGKATPELFHDAKEIEQRALALSVELGINIQPNFEVFIAKPKYQNTSDRGEWTYIRKNGTRFKVLLSISSLWDDKGHLIGYTSIATDITEQKRIEERIKESETHLQALVSSLDDIIFELDEHGRFNKIWARHDYELFLPREQIYGRTLTEMFGEEFAKPFEEGLKKVLQTGETYNREYKTLHKNDERWFNAKYSLIYEHSKPTTRISLSIQDITDRKKTELSLRQSEEKFRLLAENIPGVIYLCRNDDTYSMIYVNDNIALLTGYSTEEFITGTINFVKIFHPEDKAYVIASIDHSIASRKSFHIQYRIEHKSGDWRWVEETGIGVYSGDTLLMIEGFITDITDQKKAEEEFNRIQEENFRIFNNTLNLNAIINFEGILQKLNPAWEKTLGWKIVEMESQKIIDFIHPDDTTKTHHAITHLANGNALSTFENRYRCQDGSYRWLHWSFSPDMARKLIYGTAIDITERKISEEELLFSKKNLEVAAFELQEQNRQLDEFAHIISHNLRSPVGNIKALINFINDGSRMEDYQLIFDKISKVAANLNETMNELMETLKIKKNTEVERIEIRFKDILDKVVQSLEGELIECGATVTFDFNYASKIIYSKTYLESILQNLLSNAIKYRSPERKPNIHITTEYINGAIELRFADNGLGIDMQQHSHKLFGLHKTFHENKEARGVGLFLTKTQIEAMGGSITAESQVNQGTTFIIRF